MVGYVSAKLDMTLPIVIMDKHKRPQELDYLKGDASRIKALGWEPEYSFETMLDEMIEYWMKYYKAI